MFLLDFLLLSLQNKYGNITNNHLRVQSHLSWNFRTKKPSMNKMKNEGLQWNNRTWANTPFWFIHWFLLSFTERSDELRKKREGMQTIRKAACSEILFVVWLPFALFLNFYKRESQWHRSLLWVFWERLDAKKCTGWNRLESERGTAS